MNWLVAFLACGVAVSGVTAGPTSAPVERPVVLSSAVYPDGVTDEPSYDSWLKDEADRMTAAADGEAVDSAKIEANLALVNWLLATRIEPAATRIVLGLEQAGDRTEVRRIAGTAVERLDRARELIDAYHPEDAAAEDDTAESWSETRETLEVFARGLAAIGEPGEADSSDQRRAAVAFALYLDDSRRQVALYARLWQAVLLIESGEAERAARSLKPTLEPIADAFPEFFLRILRVRAALKAAPESDTGRYASALALLLRLEERCEEAFDSMDTARLAEQTCGVIRAQLARQWRESLKGRDESAASAVDELAQDVGEGDGPIEILRLRRAVPILIAAGGEVPEEAQAVEAESQPAPDDEEVDHSEEDGEDAGEEEGPPPEM